MTYKGRVENGVVVFGEGAVPPDGTEVIVSPSNVTDRAGGAPGNVWATMRRLAAEAERQPTDLPSDLAAEHDHYLHGRSKRGA